MGNPGDGGGDGDGVCVDYGALWCVGEGGSKELTFRGVGVRGAGGGKRIAFSLSLVFTRHGNCKIASQQWRLKINMFCF